MSDDAVKTPRRSSGSGSGAARRRSDQRSERRTGQARTSGQPRNARRRQSATKQASSNGSGGSLRARDVARRAAEELLDLLGAAPESVTSIERQDGGWLVDLDVVEVERIPDTTSIIAAYEVRLDEQGDLLGYRRVGRHVRGRTEDR
jgi:hypothetical protein